MHINPNVFRAYDIRGVADRDFGDAFVYRLGQALGSFVAKRGGGNRIAVGRDCRLSSPRIHSSFCEGLMSVGSQLFDIGIVPSPVLYFAANTLDVNGSVIITGSHNPGQDNGFKILLGKQSIHGEQVQELRLLVEEGAFVSKPGSIESVSLEETYLDFLEKALNLGPRRFKVVVDAGNGTGGQLAARLYRRLGFTVSELYCQMDGRFPNHHPDPTVPENLKDLQQLVEQEGAEIGIALDGDGDRIGAVDGSGRILWGDQLLLLFGRAILEELPGSTIIGEVKCSQQLFDEIEKAGGNPIMWKVGHALIKAKMKETGALLAGEMSGHIFFAHRYLGYDDAIYAGARLLELLSHSADSLEELASALPKTVTTPEIRIPTTDSLKFSTVERVAAQLRDRKDVEEIIDIDGVRARFSDGWGLVRASNTQPVLVMRCEAHSQERLREIESILRDTVQSASDE